MQRRVPSSAKCAAFKGAKHWLSQAYQGRSFRLRHSSQTKPLRFSLSGLGSLPKALECCPSTRTPRWGLGAQMPRAGRRRQSVWRSAAPCSVLAHALSRARPLLRARKPGIRLGSGRFFHRAGIVEGQGACRALGPFGTLLCLLQCRI